MSDEQVEYKIAERFHSLQGEGLYAGTPMHFIRLAGCTVGKHQSSEEVLYEMGPDTPLPILKTRKPAWLCHTHDDRPFWCDTDFNVTEKVSVEELIDDTFEDHICLTGGEPTAYDLGPLIRFAYAFNKTVHVETSGTILLPLSQIPIWVAVSPKKDFLPEMIRRASEIKLLVDPGFRLDKVPDSVNVHPLVYIQPINDEMDINMSNLQLCMEILQLKPHWRLSTQMHKVWRVR